MFSLMCRCYVLIFILWKGMSIVHKLKNRMEKEVLGGKGTEVNTCDMKAEGTTQSQRRAGGGLRGSGAG